MILSFLKSMQNKSQDAQNPGLWVNGNRMPTNLNEMFPPGQRRDDAETNSPMPGSQAETDNNKRKADAELAAKIAANKEAQDAKKDDDDDKNDTADNDVFVGKGKTDPRFVKKELKNANRPMLIGPNYHENGRRFADNSKALGTNSSGVRGDDHSYISKKKQEEMDASTDPAVLERVRLRKERKARIAARKKGAQSSFEPDYLSDHRNRTNLDVDGNDPTPEKEELTWQQQEKQNEERLEGGALKQKGKLGKLLKENTNRSMFLTHLQGMQNKSQEAQNPGLWVNGNRMPIREENAGKIDRNIIRKGNEEQDNPRNAEDEPVLTAPDSYSGVERMMGWDESGFPKDKPAVIPKDTMSDLLATSKDPDYIRLVNSPWGRERIGKAGEAGPDTVRRIQQNTRYEESERLAATAKANPDLTDRMKQDPRNHARLIKSGKMTQQEADTSTKQDNGYDPGGLMSGQYMPKAMQENTNRSMFLTHLQGMQTNSQGAQNPGLWVNGMRQPIQETSNKRRADYLLRVAGLTEPTPGTPPRSMRQRRKTNSGRGANLAFQGEDGQGIPANLLGGPTMKNNIAREMGVSDEVVYPKDHNFDGQVSKAEKELTPMLPVPFFKGLEGPNRGRGTGYWASTQ